MNLIFIAKIYLQLSSVRHNSMQSYLDSLLALVIGLEANW